ncbi:heavy metal translocating P-type ATPase [Klebsiella sp. WOUb02]|uniref:heavy metal translocating P-type ATPase n=1 Tax=Klebsiella sp. WOUb02 TaxID=3161071 RepID=UPI003CF6FFAC
MTSASPGSTPWGQSWRIAFFTLYGAALLAAGAWLFSCIHQVAPDSRAVVFQFGRPIRVENAGLLFAWPHPVNSIELVPAAERILERDVAVLRRDQQLERINNWERDGDAGAGAGYLLTGDEGVVQLDVRVFWRVSDPIRFALQRAHIEPLIDRLTERAAAVVCMERGLDAILVARPESPQNDRHSAEERIRLRSDFRRSMAQSLAQMAAGGNDPGIVIERVDIVSSLPANAVAAFNAVLTASQQADKEIASARTAATLLGQQAQQQADRIIQQAQAGRQETLAKANVDTRTILQAGANPARRQRWRTAATSVARRGRPHSVTGRTGHYRRPGRRQSPDPAGPSTPAGHAAGQREITMSQSCSHGHIHFSNSLQTPAERRRMARRLTLAMITLGLLLLSLLWRAVAPDQPAIGDILAGVAWLLVAVPVFRAGWHSLLHPDLHGVTDLLIVLAMLGAWALGDLMTAALLPVIMIFGHILEERSVMGTRQAIAGLSKLAHSRARRLREDGSLENIGSQQLRPGDVVEVRAGDQIPADGKILSGNASLDVASITGESVPAEVCPGMSVFGGTLNLNGLLRLEITHTGEHSTLGKVLALMQDAERAKPPITRMLERYAGHYLILVLLIAATTWFLTFDSQAMLAVLVAACPCALVLSAPATSMAGIAVAARHGILIRNAAFLEELADVDAVIIDKTGTLTQGRLRLVDVAPATSRPRESLLQLASALGAASNHPVSRAMVGAPAADGEIPLREVEEIQGLGVVATTAAGQALLGRKELFDRYRIAVAPLPDHDGPTVGIAEGGVFLGWLLLDDTIRPEAPEAIGMLQKLGVGRFLLLTGDRLAVAQRVAQRTGIDEPGGRSASSRKAAAGAASRQ